MSSTMLLQERGGAPTPPDAAATQQLGVTGRSRDQAAAARSAADSGGGGGNNSISLFASASRELLSALAALAGLPLPAASGSRDGQAQLPARPTPPPLAPPWRAGRASLLLRVPALLDSAGAGDLYEELLALDQFNVKRAVLPGVLAGLPCRGPTEADRQRRCLICLEGWSPTAGAGGGAGRPAGRPAAAAAAAAAEAATGPAAACAGSPCSCCGKGRKGSPGGARCAGGHSARDGGGGRAPADVAPPQGGLLPFIQQLPCGHEFCRACIAPWLAEHVTCPICRWSFTDDLTHLVI